MGCVERYNCIPRDWKGAMKESCKVFSSPRIVREEAPDVELEKADVNSVKNALKYKPEINMLEVIDDFDDDIEDENKTQETKDFSESWRP